MHDLPLLTTIAAAFAAAWVLGLITHKLGLSPIVGYLLAGIILLIGGLVRAGLTEHRTNGRCDGHEQRRVRCVQLL